jgi:hypothetical protein
LPGLQNKLILCKPAILANRLISESWTPHGLINKRPPSDIQSELRGTILNFLNQ